MVGFSAPFEIRMEWDAQSSCWVSHVPALNGLSTFGQSYDEAWEMTREAVALFLEEALAAGDKLPFNELQAPALPR
jgi:predicted RNase H-like HicB family nuclease